MTLATWLFLTLAHADPSAPDPARICASEAKVALTPEVQRSFRAPAACPSLIPAQTVADYLKAFAVGSRDLADPDNADRLARTVEARWLWVRAGEGHQVYDAEAKAFVPPTVFATATEPEPKTEAQQAAEAAYVHAYGALRAKKYDQAGAKLAECLEADPAHAGCHWELGWVRWVAEDWAGAAASWLEVERLRPDYPELGQWLPKAKAKANGAANGANGVGP